VYSVVELMRSCASNVSKLDVYKRDIKSRLRLTFHASVKFNLVDAQLAGVLKATLLPRHKLIVSPQRCEGEYLEK
jgi:hypothetical protein